MSHVSGSSMPWDASCHMCQELECALIELHACQVGEALVSMTFSPYHMHRHFTACTDTQHACHMHRYTTCMSHAQIHNMHATCTDTEDFSGVIQS